MIEAGTDIFRLNCSHRRGGDFERVYPLIRKTAKEMGKKAPWMVCVIMCTSTQWSYRRVIDITEERPHMQMQFRVADGQSARSAKLT